MSARVWGCSFLRIWARMRGLTFSSSWKGVGPVSRSRESMMYLAVSLSQRLGQQTLDRLRTAHQELGAVGQGLVVLLEHLKHLLPGDGIGIEHGLGHGGDLVALHPLEHVRRELLAQGEQHDGCFLRSGEVGHFLCLLGEPALEQMHGLIHVVVGQLHCVILGVFEASGHVHGLLVDLFLFQGEALGAGQSRHLLDFLLGDAWTDQGHDDRPHHQDEEQEDKQAR